MIVGVFAVVAILLLYFGFNFLKGVEFFSTTNHYYAKYDNISQLTISNPVLVNGFAVGRVSDIRLMEGSIGNQVMVELEIDSKVIIGKGAKATLNSDFLGSKSILLNIGNYQQPLKDNDTIQADVAKGMLDMLSATATPVADNLQTTLRKLNTLMDSFGANMDQLVVVIKNLQSTPGKLNNTLDKASSKMDDISISIKSVADKLNGTMSELDPTLKNFKTLSDSLNQLRINQTLNKVSATLNNLNATLAKLNSGDNTASKLLTDDALYNNLNDMLKAIDSLANHFNSHPSHFLSPLGKSSKKIERDHKKDADKK